MSWRWFRQRSLQYSTSSQFFAHFFRQVNGRPQVAQVFVGRSCFLTPRTLDEPLSLSTRRADLSSMKQ